jgi:hypothetical protein
MNEMTEGHDDKIKVLLLQGDGGLPTHCNVLSGSYRCREMVDCQHTVMSYQGLTTAGRWWTANTL